MTIEYSWEQRDLLRNNQAIPLTLEKDNVIYHCPNCLDLGTVMVWKITGGPYASPSGKGAKWIDVKSGGLPRGWYSGELVSANCPACSSGKLRAWLENRCGLSGRDLSVTLSQFVVEQGKQEAYDTAASLLSMNREPHGFVTLHGSYGTGKSMLLKSIVNGFRGMDILSAYREAGAMLDEIRATYGSDDQNAAQAIIAQLSEYKVLCLDEFDRFNPTSWAKQMMFQILNARYNGMDRLLTVLATNLPPQDLPAELGYLWSRMTEGKIVEVGGVDMRPVVGALEVEA